MKAALLQTTDFHLNLRNAVIEIRVSCLQQSSYHFWRLKLIEKIGETFSKFVIFLGCEEFSIL